MRGIQGASRGLTCPATGVVLAGGRSHRMGQDKLVLEVGGMSLLDRVRSAVASRCDEVLVVGERSGAPAGVRFLPDLRPTGRGPLAGIEAGLSASRHRAVFVAAGDLPFLSGELVEYLLDLLSDHTLAVVPRFLGRLHPLCAAYGREVRPLVSTALDEGVGSVRELVESLPDVRYVEEAELRRFGDPEFLLANVNSPEDLTRARSALRA